MEPKAGGSTCTKSEAIFFQRGGSRMYTVSISTKGKQVNQSISNGGVCRTAPATPGLLIIVELTLFLFQGGSS